MRGRSTVTGILFIAVLVVAVPGALRAQECRGSKPGGSTWVRSAEQYMKEARETAWQDDEREAYERMLSTLEEGIERQPDNPRHYELAGIAYAGLGDLVGADSMWSKAEALWSCYAVIDTLRYTEAAKAYNRGIARLNEGDLAAAEEQFRLGFRIYDKLPHPMLQLGDVYANQAMTAPDSASRAEAEEKAIEVYSAALESVETSDRLDAAERDEFSRGVTFNMAQLLAFGGKYLEAAQAYEEYLAAQPDNADARSNCAVVLVRAAYQIADEAAQMEDGSEREAALAKADSLQGAANEYFGQLVDRDDLTADQYHNLGSGLRQIQRDEDAIPAFVKALDREPYRANSLEQLAYALYYSQRYDTLKVVAASLVDRYPLSQDNLALLANAYVELQLNDSALAIFERRETIPFELRDLELIDEAGTYTVTGTIHNLSLETGAQAAVAFEFYNEAGEAVTSVTEGFVMPEQGSLADFSIAVDPEAPVLGFTYSLASLEAGT